MGKDLFRAKEHEEDIMIINEVNKAKFPVSLKAYGVGPLQLSTDKESKMFSRLEREKREISTKGKIKEVLSDPAFLELTQLNVLPLIYDEENKRCNILVFDYDRAVNETAKILRVAEGRGRKHPVHRFFDCHGGYICEVRYGGATANALQRGFWTHTKYAVDYFDSLTGGWIDYSHNIILVKLFSHALVSSAKGHETALEKIKEDIEELKNESGFMR